MVNQKMSLTVQDCVYYLHFLVITVIVIIVIVIIIFFLPSITQLIVCQSNDGTCEVS